MLNNNKDLSGSQVALFLSSKHEMQAKIDELRSGAAMAQNAPAFNPGYPPAMPVTSQYYPQPQQAGSHSRYSAPASGMQTHHLQQNQATMNGSGASINQMAPGQNGGYGLAQTGFRPRQPQFPNSNGNQSAPAYPNSRFQGPRGSNQQGGQQNMPTGASGQTRPGFQNPMQPQVRGPMGPGFKTRGGFDPRVSRFPAVRGNMPVRGQMDGTKPGFRPGMTSTPQQNRPARPGAFDIVRASGMRPGTPQRPPQPQGSTMQPNPSVTAPQPNSFNRPRIPFQRGPAVGQGQVISSSQTPVTQPPNEAGMTVPNMMPNNVPASVSSPTGMPGTGMMGPRVNMAPVLRMPPGAGFIRPNKDGPAVATSVVSNIVDSPSDFNRESDRKLGDRSTFDRIDRQHASRNSPDRSSNDVPSLAKTSSRDNSSKGQSDDHDRSRHRRSSSRDRSGNKRSHTADSRSSASPPPSKVAKSYFYCMLDRVSIDVTDTHIRDFLGGNNCKSNMKPIILAKRNSCTVYLRFDDERNQDRCLQLQGRRLLNESSKIYICKKEDFDDAYKEFQSEMNREIFELLKRNHYKGEFIQITGLPEHVNNDDIMSLILKGEKLQVDDIYVAYANEESNLPPQFAFVRATTRKDAERLCSNSGRYVLGSTVEIGKISEGQMYQKVKDHQNQISGFKSSEPSNNRQSRSPPAAMRESRDVEMKNARESDSKSGRRRSVPRSLDSGDNDSQPKEREQTKTKQCPDDVCVEIMSLPKGKFDKRDIREFFKKLKVMHVVFDPNDESKAYIEFDKDKEQIIALRMNNQKLGDHVMRILAIESSEYSKIYLQHKSKQESKAKEIEAKFEKVSSNSRESSESSSSRGGKRSAYPKQFYKILFKKPICTSLDVVRKFLQVTFESHIVLRKDPGGFTSEAYLMTCENPESHFLGLEGKSICSIEVIVCKINEEDFKNGTNNIQPSPTVTATIKPKSPEPVAPKEPERLPEPEFIETTQDLKLESMEVVEGDRDRSLPNSTVKVSELPPRVSTSDVEKLFTGIRVRSNGIAMFSEKREAIVILENSIEKEKALGVNNTVFIGCKIQVETCSVAEAISRFPLAQLRPIAIADMETLSSDYVIAMMEGIPKGCEAKQLQELLKPCKIVSVTFMRAVSTAFVQMQNSLDAQFCTLKSGFKISDCEVTITPKRKMDMEKMISDFKKKGSSVNNAAKASQQQQPPQQTNGAVVAQQPPQNQPETPVKTEATPNKPPLPPIDTTPKKPEFAVHLSNLPTTVIKNDIIQLFQSLPLQDSRIILRVNELARIADAIVLLASLAECTTAFELNQTFLGPNKVNIRIVTGNELHKLISSFGQINSPFQAPTPKAPPNTSVGGFDPITLRLSGLPIDVNPSDILDFFNDFNPNPEMLNICNDSITRACTAQLSFNNRNLGLEALKQKQGQFLGGRKILITSVL
ncbi:uncharacterized protein LOC142351944 isoform X2 [Convolutriloba macropyga]